jgi:hypothetical protein
MAQELERNIIVQEPEWFKNNHGSRTMMAQDGSRTIIYGGSKQ